MPQKKFEANFQDNQKRTCTPGQSFSPSIPLPSPLADWLVPIFRRIERQAPSADKQ